MEFLKETVTDADGNIYHTVKIGNQVWTMENLRTMKYNDGTAIPLVTDKNAWDHLRTPGYCWYDNDKNNMNKYGALYNWYAVNTGKPAPNGWHVSSDEEWGIFEKYLIANGYNWDRTTEGNKIAKSLAAKMDWETATAPGAIGNDLTENNRSGFSALPGGSRGKDGGFSNVGYGEHWWSATGSATGGGASLAVGRCFGCDAGRLERSVYDGSCGLSVRLLRD
jgi:uncharacterized protein (TIGR02145 family)